MVTRTLATTSVGKLSILEGNFSVVHFTIGFEHRTATNIEDLGVGSVKTLIDSS